MTEDQHPPRDNLIRAQPGVEIRRADGDAMPTLFGHFVRFNSWTMIDSKWEGKFMERFAPGAFTKTIKENLPHMRVLLNHGQDPTVGDKPLGPIEVLREDDQGAYYEVPLLDTSYNRDLVPALEAGLYGSSFRFNAIKDSYSRRASGSEHNPDGLPERTVHEAAVREFGPTPFPAYATSTASVRSMTDEFILRQLIGDPERLRHLFQAEDPPPALSEPRAEPAHSASESRTVPVPVQRRFKSQEDYLQWLTTSSR